ncbi:MAG: hypothetical protein LBC94_01970 [Desulfovibrio sp.]|jgi:diaminopimelate epimerase|nr:hypothetical protein [Desulfovibrio sp.]
MTELVFSKWSPGGNTTLLFPAKGIEEREQVKLARQALEEHHLGGEQAGFVNLSEGRLRMAGGEFCVNASRAFGALMALAEAEKSHPQDQSGQEGGEYRCDAQVSGWPTPIALRVRGTLPFWDVEACLRLPHCPVDNLGPDEYLVRLPGIAHLLLNADTHSFPDDCMAATAQIREIRGLAAFPASGVIWWRKRQGKLEMIPLVHVREARTTCLENACGSGALALALLLARLEGGHLFSVMQPGGSSLEVCLGKEGEAQTATVDGPVALVARGSVWLEGA